MMSEHQHASGFTHVDLPLDDLEHTYDLAWKFDPEAHAVGLLGELVEPFLLLYVSFLQTDGDMRHEGTLQFSRTRSAWRYGNTATDEDREDVRDAAFGVVPLDLAALETGESPPNLSVEGRRTV